MRLTRNFPLLLVLAAFVLHSCSTPNKTTTGAAVGAGGGAVIGGVIGSLTGHVGMGALIGAAVGGGAGAIIGRKMDKNAEAIKKSIPTAKVERVGEGVLVTFSDKILFGVGKSDLSPAAYKSMDSLAAFLTREPDNNVEIQGHTDSTGSAEINMKLSQKRADAVATYVKSKGISANRVSAKGYGFTDPVGPNNTEEGRAQNRRVQFLISANEKLKVEAAKEAQGK